MENFRSSSGGADGRGVQTRGAIVPGCSDEINCMKCCHTLFEIPMFMCILSHVFMYIIDNRLKEISFCFVLFFSNTGLNMSDK